MKTLALFVVLLTCACDVPKDGEVVRSDNQYVQWADSLPPSYREVVGEDEYTITYAVYWWRPGMGRSFYRCGPEMQTIRKLDLVENPK